MQGVRVWQFAMAFQVGMFLIGGVLIGIGISAGVAVPVVLGAVFAGVAVAGFYYSLRQLRQLRQLRGR